MREAIEQVIEDLEKSIKATVTDPINQTEYKCGQNMGMKVAYAHAILELKEVLHKYGDEAEIIKPISSNQA